MITVSLFLIWFAGVFAAGAWSWLLLVHGRFWRADQWLPAERGEEDPLAEGATASWPPVAVIIPARDEAAVIGDTIAAHRASTYPGPFTVILVDDGSSDGTADLARAAWTAGAPSVSHAGAAERAFHVLAAPPLAPGWTGKLAAQHAGLSALADLAPQATHLLLTDADILHGPDTLTGMMHFALTREAVLVSLMARLDSRGFWGGLLIPPFIFFFQKLYPFPWSNDPAHPLAAGAGGCMLADRKVLEDQGGMAAIRGALIDDCTLAALMKGAPPRRRIWIGLTRKVLSLRDNRRLASVWTMVARTAYAQLHYSPILLAGTLLGMILVYLAGPLLALTFPLHGLAGPALLGISAWLAMAVTFAPTARLYGQSRLRGFLLPLAGALYTAMTLDSALRTWRGKGGQWKGRTYSAPGS